MVFPLQSINQSDKKPPEYTSTREATSQHHHTGSKTRVAKRRRLLCCHSPFNIQVHDFRIMSILCKGRSAPTSGADAKG